MLAISFSGIFKPIGNVFKGISSTKFTSIIDKVVLPLASVGLAIKNARSPQQLPPAPPVQPDTVAPDTTNAGGSGTGTGNARKSAPWYANPLVYIGGAVAVLAGVLILGRKGGA